MRVTRHGRGVSELAIHHGECILGVGVAGVGEWWCVGVVVDLSPNCKYSRWKGLCYPPTFFFSFENRVGAKESPPTGRGGEVGIHSRRCGRMHPGDSTPPKTATRTPSRVCSVIFCQLLVLRAAPARD